jgi:hypothetical protein
MLNEAVGTTSQLFSDQNSKKKKKKIKENSGRIVVERTVESRVT